MFRAILPDGDVQCASYEETDRGVKLYTEGEQLVAFIPYENLVALMNEEINWSEDRSIM